jgi:hypothetical protein
MIDLGWSGHMELSLKFVIPLETSSNSIQILRVLSEMMSYKKKPMCERLYNPPFSIEVRNSSGLNCNLT